MHVLPLEELAYLIRSPREWNQVYANFEFQKQLDELKKALEALPPSSIRDSRIARILFHQGKKDEAKALVYQHRNCPLCQAWYFAMLVNTGEEDTMRKIVALKVDKPLGPETINLEAEYRLHLSIGIAAMTLKKHDLAQEHFGKALLIAEVLQDNQGKVIVQYEHAWALMYSDQLDAALEKFSQVYTTARPQSTLSEFSIGYSTLLSWILDVMPRRLPALAQEHLKALRGEPALDETPLVQALRELRGLTRQFHLFLPLFHVAANNEARDARIRSILKLTENPELQITGFIKKCARALALSMNHQKEAVEVLEAGFSGPVTSMSIMSMIYSSTFVQIHANLPHLPKTREVKAQLRRLVFQFSAVPEGQKRWLVKWMRDFTPVTMYILAEAISELKEHTADFAVVDSKGAKHKGQKIKRYPVEFMQAHCIELLSGQHAPASQRMQAYRHHRGLTASGADTVIFQPVIDLLQKNFN